MKEHFCPAEQSTITYQGKCNWCGESEGSMNEIIEMAREAGGQVTAWVNHSTIQKTTTFTFESPLDYYVSGEYPEKYHIKFLEAFAKLVAAKEREACAKVCEELPAPNIYSDTDKAMWDVTCMDCATAIRARGQA